MSESIKSYIRDERDYKHIPNQSDLNVEFKGFSEDEFIQFSPLLQKMIRSYMAKSSEISDADWLSAELAKELPCEKEEDIAAITQDILSSVKDYNDIKKDAVSARNMGDEPDEWFADKLTSSFAGTMEAQAFGERLAELDVMLHQSNKEMMDVVTTKSGSINMNPNLDGFIAEQDLVSTFNMNAKLTNSNYEARLINPEGANFGKNSVDIGIYDKSSGHLAQRYQVKAGKDPVSDYYMLKKGNFYPNQRKIVSHGHEKIVEELLPGHHTVTDRLEAPDGTTSAPLDKNKCKRIQQDVQNGKSLPIRDWTDFDNKSLALHLGKEVAFAGVAGAALEAGMNIAGKAISGERIEADEVVAAAIRSGADSGIKTATACALTVASKKGILPCLVGASTKSISMVACYAIESVRIIADYLSGEIDGSEAAARFMWLAATTYIANTISGALGLGLGTLLSGAIVLACTPVGAAVAIGAGLVAGAIAFGSEICEIASSIVDGIGNVVSDVWDGVTSVISDIGSAVGEIFDSIFG